MLKKSFRVVYSAKAKKNKNKNRRWSRSVEGNCQVTNEWVDLSTETEAKTNRL